MAGRASSGWLRDYTEPLRSIYLEVLVMSLFINMLALAVPVFILQVYDRVIFHAGLTTLQGLAIGIVIVIVFDHVLRQARMPADAKKRRSASMSAWERSSSTRCWRCRSRIWRAGPTRFGYRCFATSKPCATLGRPWGRLVVPLRPGADAGRRHLSRILDPCHVGDLDGYGASRPRRRRNDRCGARSDTRAAAQFWPRVRFEHGGVVLGQGLKTARWPSARGPRKARRFAPPPSCP